MTITAPARRKTGSARVVQLLQTLSYLLHSLGAMGTCFSFLSYPHCITISGPVLLSPRMLLRGAVPVASGFSLPAQSQPGAPCPMHKDKCPPSHPLLTLGVLNASAGGDGDGLRVLGRLVHPHLAGARVKKIPNPTRKQLS